ncbi:MAG TPA: hypothetical protein VFO86_16580 [Terriglobia bacterium]|nr:hypothetical protein [Terriglobia bacterium]
MAITENHRRSVQLCHFTMRGVAPGEYKVFTWENVYNNAWLNARYLEHFESQGRPITINPSPQPLELEAIPTENYLEFWAR